jgi:CHAT domain-containing protein
MVTAPQLGSNSGHYQLAILESREMVPADEERLAAQGVFSRGMKDIASVSEPAQARAAAAFEDAARLCHQEGDEPCQAESLYWLGLLRSRAGHYPSARSALEQAAALFRQANDEMALLKTEDALGPVYGQMGEIRDGLRFHLRALQLWRIANDRRGQTAALGEIGGNQYAKGDYHAALATFQEALGLQNQLGDKQAQAGLLEDIGKVYAAQQDYEHAIQMFFRELTLRQMSGDQRGEASALSFIGEVLRSHGKPSEALPYFKRSKMLRHDMGDISAEAGALIGVAATQRDLGDLPASVATLREAMTLRDKLQEGISSPRWRAGVQVPRDYASPLILELAELHHAHPEGTYEREAFLAAERAHRVFFQDSPLAGDLSSVAEFQRAELDEDTLLLEYWIEPEISVVWALTKEGLSLFPLASAVSINSLIQQLYGATMARGQTIPSETASGRLERIAKADRDYERVAPALSDLLLGPVRSFLSKKRVVVVGYGALQYVPFSILLDPSRSDRAPLIVEHEVVSIPSASALARSRASASRRREPPRLLAVLADPVFDANDPRVRGHERFREPSAISEDLVRATRAAGVSPPIPRLLFSGREERQLLQVVPSNLALALRGFEAAREIVLQGGLSDYRIWHFASHALLNDDPELSGLILSLVDPEGHPVDGFLRTRDLYDLRVTADMVVLSACQTGLGRSYKGAGILSLTTAFLRAGARRVLSSAWSVDDEVTEKFMTAFYQGMLGAQKLPPAEALREAQLAIRRQAPWRSAYYWGGFVLNGDWD